MHAQIERAIRLLAAGELVAFPTETVYGLGADARNPEAVAKVFAAKGRPANHPLIVHLADYDQLSDWAVEVPDSAHMLAQAFWPGPLTLVLKKARHVLDSVTAGQSTVALRIPRHPLAIHLLKAYGSGLVAPSANRFTHISPTTAQAVQDELGNQVSLILDGGDCEVGLESTIIDLSADQPRILRPGMITATMVEEVLQEKVSLRQHTVQPIAVPGMHPVHYAPRTQTFLVETSQLHQVVQEIAGRIAVVTYQSFPTINAHTIQLANDPNLYAQQLYRTLRELDQQQFHAIYIQDVPQDLKWAAIHDRLFKASGSKRIG